MNMSKKVYRWASCLMIPIASVAVIGCGTNTNTSQPTQTTNKTVSTQTKSHVVKTADKVTTYHSFTIPILEYHTNAYVKNFPWSLDPGQFEPEMAYLHSHHFHTITLQQVYDAYKYGTKLPSRPVVITFDDGHVSNYTVALPILKKYGFVATENMISGAIGKKGELTAKDLLVMQNSGVFSIESHTVTHPYLAKMSAKRVTYEVTQSKKTLTKLLGRPVNFFCFPYGSYNASVLKAVKKAGYLMAVTSNYGYANPVVDGPYLLHRMSVHQGLSLKTFEKWLQPDMRSISSKATHQV